jgi:hypothetical protein
MPADSQHFDIQALLLEEVIWDFCIVWSCACALYFLYKLPPLQECCKRKRYPQLKKKWHYLHENGVESLEIKHLQNIKKSIPITWIS